jgi:CDP-L-myo-inositol myo-inositolphosphotransferase
MKCLIIAAGKGSRLQRRGDSKPLIPILGIPIIERVIRTALGTGVDEFYVVIGYQGDQVRDFLEGLSKRLAIRITPLVNDDWEKENGLSVLKAREVLHEPFLLLMADHLFDPGLASALTTHSLLDGEIALGVDGDIHNSLVNMDDVTRVKVENGNICDIGKGMTDFNGFDTGIFLCSPAIFKVLELSKEKDGDMTLSGAVRALAAEGRAKAIPVSGFWIDIDDPRAFNKAEDALLKQLSGKSRDGPVSKYLNRPVSLWISRYLVRTFVTPNQISVFSFLLSIVAAVLFAVGGYPFLAIGGLLAQIASVIDGCDGEIARLKFQSSKYGGWFDAVLDRYGDAFMLFGLTWHVFAAGGDGLTLFVGFMAIIGSFMNSYTADKYDGLMRSRLHSGRGIRIGRDVRVFMIFVGVLLNLPFWTLLAIALLTNLETVRRVIVCRENE